MKKLSLIIASAALGLVLAGCTPSTPAPTKEATINIAMEDNKQYNEREFVVPTITVEPSTLAKTVKYYKGQQDLGETAPQTYGDYTISVTTEQTSEYKATTASKSFMIRKVPTLVFYYGDGSLLENTQFKEGEDYNIYATSSVEGAQIEYSYSDANGNPLQNKPTAIGVYSITASVARTEVIGQASRTATFEIISATPAQNPVVRFFYNDVEVLNHWPAGGYGHPYYPDEFDVSKLSYTVTPEMEADERWLKDEVRIDALPNPLTEGTYTWVITPSGYGEAYENWLAFQIHERSEKPTPELTFYYNDGEDHILENGMSFAVGSVTMRCESSIAGVAMHHKYTANDGEVDLGQDLPTTPGRYALNVWVDEGENNAAVGNTWRWFDLYDASKEDVTISFTYNGSAASVEAHWLDPRNITPAQALTVGYSISPEAARGHEVVSWTLNEVPIQAPTSAEDFVPGTYTMRIDVAEGSSYNAGANWVNFIIPESN